MLGRALYLLLTLPAAYAAVLVFRNWRSTVPAGAEDDSEFANHGLQRADPVSRL